MFSVSGVSGAARTTKSDSASSSGSPSGPRTAVDTAAAERPALVALVGLPGRAAGARPGIGPAAGRDDPAAERRRERRRPPGRSSRARRCRPSRRAARAPSSGCHVRSRWSSRSWGSRRLTARIIIRTYSAIGRLKTPRAFVMTMPRARPAGVRTRSTPADAEWTQARRGRAGEEPVERVGGEPAAEQHLDVVERPVGQALARDVDDPRARAPPPGSGRGRGPGSAPTGSA